MENTIEIPKIKKKVDPFKSREYAKKYYNDHKSARSEKALQYYYDNKERILQRMNDERKDPQKIQEKYERIQARFEKNIGLLRN